MNILVRNLSRDITEEELMQMFQPFGKIDSLNIVNDAATGKSKGFGFVEMPEVKEAAAAIKGLNGKIIKGLRLRVKVTNQKRPDDRRPPRSRPESSCGMRRGESGRGRHSGGSRGGFRGQGRSR